jgi:hypothetical protein
MIGNLKMYLGPDDINHYGEFLAELLVPLLPAHGGAVDPAHRPDRRECLHIHAAYSLTCSIARPAR